MASSPFPRCGRRHVVCLYLFQYNTVDESIRSSNLRSNDTAGAQPAGGKPKMIKNVVFDIGNVFVNWSPPEVIRRSFGHEHDSAENRERTMLLRSPLWLRLNRGE